MNREAGPSSPRQRTRTRSVNLADAELEPLDLDELLPLPPSHILTDYSRSSSSSSFVHPASPEEVSPSWSGSPSPRTTRLPLPPLSVGTEPGSSSQEQEPASATCPQAAAARYLTVSAVLSRSGARIVSADKGAEGLLWQPPPEGALHGASSRLRRRAPASRRASNGSALEAVGALLLRRDSVGTVSNLSFERAERQARRDAKRPGLLQRASRAWMLGIREVGAAQLGIQMPALDSPGGTIAERRARKMGTLAAQEQEVLVVGGKRNTPSFELSRPATRQPVLEMGTPDTPSTVRPSTTPPRLPQLRRARSEVAHSTSGVFGTGSAWGIMEPLEAPPSPIGMPGAWSGGASGWLASRPGDGHEDGALLLPPPLLDDKGSDHKSFEGLLGVRRMREREKAMKQLERLKARNRPAHKVGVMTALSNFVRAAHAADLATRAAAKARRPDTLQRRHTEPQRAAVAEDEENDADNDATPSIEALVSSSIEMTRMPSLRKSSLDAHSRSLDTLYEGEAAVDAFEMSPPSDGRHTRRSSSSSSWSESESFPPAPRLLPVHLSVPGSPFTPMALDSRAPSRRASISSSLSQAADYLSARPRAPTTPRLGPTLLSLPPSPWTPHASAGAYQVQLLTSPTLRAAPGTPRLAPTHIEVLPSPFPNTALSERSVSPLSAQTSPVALQAMSSATTRASSPSQSPILSTARSRRRNAPARSAAGELRELEGTPSKGASPGGARLTPSAMLAAWPEQQQSSTPTQSSARTFSASASRRRSLSASRVATSKPPAQAIGAMPGRSWVLWFFFGDLGLGARSSVASKASGQRDALVSVERYGGIPTLLVHAYGFVVFLLAHAIDLAYRIAENMALAFWFLRWLALNMTGQTVLARCVIDAYRLIQEEWATVALEDHEERGTKRGKHGKTEKPRGLSYWQTARGLVELVCLYAVTRQRYLDDGAGLERLEGWQRKQASAPSRSNSKEPVDIGMQKEKARRAAQQRAEALAAETSRDSDDDARSEDEDSSSDDDELVVTRQGIDVLEFSKTPRLEPRTAHGERVGSGGGYFTGSRLGAESLPNSTATAPTSTATTSAGAFPPGACSTRKYWDPRDTRSLVRTMKWASRLAISAYGLHVTLVDLPATFTPSGNRFSRQTFAHLSRIRSDDVLHADIQTLDSDTYHPTFYLVRDYARRCVCVSVRGTQSLQDIIVDLEMVTTKIELPVIQGGEESGEAEDLTCHAGVLRAAKALIEKDSTMFATLSQALVENEGFDVVFTGHSLGGAIASTVVLLLSEYRIAPGAPRDSGEWLTRADTGLPAGRAIRAMTFAHPATVSATLAERAALGAVPLVTTVTLGSDIIPRCGHGQARELRRLLGALARVRRRHDLSRKDADEDARVHIISSWWDWRSIQRAGDKADAVMLHRAERIEEQLWKLRCDVEADLYAAIKRRTTCGSHEGFKSRGTVPPSPWIGPQQRAAAPLHQLAARRQALDAATLRSEAAQGGVLIPPGRSFWIDGSDLYAVTAPLSFFSSIDLDYRCLAQHFPSAYESALNDDLKL